MSNYFMPKQSVRNPYFEAMLKEGTNTSPIGAHSQGMSRLAFALLAGLERGQMDRDERERREGMAAQGRRQQPDQPAYQAMPSAGTVDPNPQAAADVTAPETPPTRMPPVAGTSGQPIMGEAGLPMPFGARSGVRGTLLPGTPRAARRYNPVTGMYE